MINKYLIIEVGGMTLRI